MAIVFSAKITGVGEETLYTHGNYYTGAQGLLILEKSSLRLVRSYPLSHGLLLFRSRLTVSTPTSNDCDTSDRTPMQRHPLIQASLSSGAASPSGCAICSAASRSVSPDPTQRLPMRRTQASSSRF